MEKTEKKDNIKVLLGVMMTLVILSGIFSFVGMTREVKVEFDTTNLEKSISDGFDSVNTKLDTTSSETPTETETPSGDYVLSKKEYEQEMTEAKALELTDAFVNSKDFKKLFEGVSYTEGLLGIEDYKDITEVKVIESEFDRHDDLVNYEIKVYFNVDGDEDDKAYIILKNYDVVVSDLEYDDEFVDAEVDEDAAEDELIADLLIAEEIKVKYFD